MSAQPITTLRPAPMTSKGIEVRREGVDGSRYYCRPGTEEQLASVTTVISATTSKPWLGTWQAKLAAECAVDQIHVVQTLLDASGRDAAVDYVKGEAKRARNAASDKGTWVHDVVEALVLDSTMPEVPDEVEPFVDAFLEFWTDWDPIALMSEATVAHPARGHAGTLDLVVDMGFPLPGGARRIMIDVKSGANLDAYMPVQMSAYRRSPEVWLRGGVVAPMLAVEDCYVLHLRPGGYKLIRVESGDYEYGCFLRMLEILSWKDEQHGRMGEVVYLPLPDGSQPPPLLEDLDLVPARNPLIAAGVYRLDQLLDACASPDVLLAMKGVGPGALAGFVPLLQAHGLEVPAELLDALAALEAKAEAAAARKAAKAEKAALALVGP